MNVAVCDDEQWYLDTIDALFKTVYHLDYKIHKFKTVTQLIDSLSVIKYELIFLDIDFTKEHLGEGIEAKRVIAEISDETSIIYITAYDKYMQQAFGKNVIGFIKKSDMRNENAKNQLVKILEYSGWRLDKGKRVVCKDNIFYTRKIISIISDNPYSQVIMNDGKKVLTSENLIWWKNNIESDFFYTDSKFYIVNYEYVDGIFSSSFFMKNGISYEIPKGKVNKAKSLFYDYRRKYMRVL